MINNGNNYSQKSNILTIKYLIFYKHVTGLLKLVVYVSQDEKPLKCYSKCRWFCIFLNIVPLTKHRNPLFCFTLFFIIN